jgi:hypothetical protein
VFSPTVLSVSKQWQGVGLGLNPCLHHCKKPKENVNTSTLISISLWIFLQVPCGTEKDQKPPKCRKSCGISPLCRHGSDSKVRIGVYFRLMLWWCFVLSKTCEVAVEIEQLMLIVASFILGCSLV